MLTYIINNAYPIIAVGLACMVTFMCFTIVALEARIKRLEVRMATLQAIIEGRI